MAPSRGKPVHSAELRIGSSFDSNTWRRPLCLKAWSIPDASGAKVDARVVGDLQRCGQGRLVASWNSASDSTAGSSVDLERLMSLDAGEIVLDAWRRLDPKATDPDDIETAEEFFPLGAGRNEFQSFLRLRLHQADNEGSDIIVLRSPWPTTSSACSATDSSCLCRPASSAYRLVPSLTGWFGSFVPAFLAPHLPLQTTGVCVLRSLVSPGNTSAVKEIADSPSAQSSHGGFIPHSPWSKHWRVTHVEEHCRDARLGLWGWIFGLKHSVLAIRMEGRGKGGELENDLLYLDKNADIGVAWRRAGFQEKFKEAPREGFSYKLNGHVGPQDLWESVTATDAFKEPQERSNCQHFVTEVLSKLAQEGKITNSGTEFSLRNQFVAEKLRWLGYLDDALKAPPGQETGRWAWRTFMSWDCKAGAMRFLTPWAIQFALRPADMALGK